MEKKAGENILKIISERRVARGWTNARLAREAGVAESTIRSLYKRQNRPSMGTLMLLCDALDISVTEAMDLDESPMNLSADERILVYKYRLVNKREKNVVTEMLDCFIDCMEPSVK